MCTDTKRDCAVPRSLTIVVPALNEEEAIGSTIERCLSARSSLQEHTPIKEVEIIVVSDGSTDRTPEIARSYESVRVIEYEKNRGYGAAIKQGFADGKGDMLGFLDADGTCDPEYFVDLCNHAIEKDADVVVGSRMTPKSKMPAIRRFGNKLYAILLSFLSNRKISDTASGMRVIRREALSKLYPLPDGLHFTPAMTCKSVFQDGLTIQELPISYQERVGRSKLNIFKDGIRFLSVITETALTYRPFTFFCGAAALLFLMAFLLGAQPVWTYLHERKIPDSFIFRLITINTLAFAGFLLLSIGIVADRVATAMNGSTSKRRFITRLLTSFCTSRRLLIAGIIPLFSGVALNYRPILDYLLTRHISHHWIYVSVGSLLVLTGLQLIALGVFELLISRIIERNGNKTGI